MRCGRQQPNRRTPPRSRPRFEAVPSHWRKAPVFKELLIRRIPEPATRLSGVRAGEIDIAQVFGDFLEQAQKASLRIHENPNAAQYWVIMTGQTTPDREDYCPTCPWVGDPANPKSLENGRKVRQALNHAVNREAIVRDILRMHGCIIKAESALGEGTVFTFTLPVVSREEPAGLPGGSSNPRGETAPRGPLPNSI